jgi:hypothetical protein
MATEERYEPRRDRDEGPVSGWAVGGMVFGATVLIIIGTFHAIAGLVALLDDEFYVVGRQYTFELDTTAWGWIHMLLGALVATAGWALLARKVWAGVMAIFLASLSSVANFFFIPYYPVWSIVLIALNIWVIWAITRPGAIET